MVKNINWCNISLVFQTPSQCPLLLARTLGTRLLVPLYTKEPALYDFNPVAPNNNMRTSPLRNLIPCICTYFLNCFLLQKLNFEPLEKQAKINPIWLD